MRKINYQDSLEFNGFESEIVSMVVTEDKISCDFTHPSVDGTQIPYTLIINKSQGGGYDARANRRDGLKHLEITIKNIKQEDDSGISIFIFDWHEGGYTYKGEMSVNQRRFFL